MVEISLLLAECMQHGLRTIAFCKVRFYCLVLLCAVCTTACMSHYWLLLPFLEASYRGEF